MNAALNVWRFVRTRFRNIIFPTQKDVLRVEAIAHSEAEEKLKKVRATHPTLDQTGRERLDVFIGQTYKNERAIAYHMVVLEFAFDYFCIDDQNVRDEVHARLFLVLKRLLQRLSLGENRSDPLREELEDELNEYLGAKTEKFIRFYLNKWRSLGVAVAKYLDAKN